MTVLMYARRKQWPLRAVTVRLDLEGKDSPEGRVTDIRREVVFDGPELAPDQRARLIDIANKCPVHKTLTGKINIATKEAS
jgi:putative redox protein